MKFERDKRTGTYYSADGSWMIKNGRSCWDVYQVTGTGDYEKSFTAGRLKEAMEIIKENMQKEAAAR